MGNETPYNHDMSIIFVLISQIGLTFWVVAYIKFTVNIKNVHVNYVSTYAK